MAEHQVLKVKGVQPAAADLDVPLVQVVVQDARPWACGIQGVDRALDACDALFVHPAPRGREQLLVLRIE